MPAKKKRSAIKKPTPKKIPAKKTQVNPLVETGNLYREIVKSQDKLDKTYAKFLAQFKKQRDRFKVKIKQAREKFSSAKTSYRKTNIKTMIKALEEKKKDLMHQLDKVSRDYKKFSAQQKVIQQFEKTYEKKEADKEKQKAQAKKIKKVSKPKATTPNKESVVTADVAKKKEQN